MIKNLTPKLEPLISTKGKINLMVDTKEHTSGIVKPAMVQEMIERTYSSSKLEIRPDRWQICGKEI